MATRSGPHWTASSTRQGSNLLRLFGPRCRYGSGGTGRPAWRSRRSYSAHARRACGRLKGPLVGSLVRNSIGRSANRRRRPSRGSASTSAEDKSATRRARASSSMSPAMPPEDPNHSTRVDGHVVRIRPVTIGPQVDDRSEAARRRGARATQRRRSRARPHRQGERPPALRRCPVGPQAPASRVPAARGQGVLH